MMISLIKDGRLGETQTDEEGERLHAVLPKSLIKGWSNVLKEFQLFNIKWLVVVESKERSRTTETDSVLTFIVRTIVTPVLNPSFPLEALRFDRCCCYGRWEGRSKEMLTKHGKELKRLVIVLEDTG
ncbi:hypothetical protein PIB30_038812 [Stylosanthes scabra]|uniref:Replication protein A 70 kDa DNA-binding subunit B/D first OB fold domain-containing protein n=1 Tax=Stylosanthes scabra TaxID=79078 RepID=A0ABU6RE79_9FABA|nr:hypothetical protein [Stylosanthes scabra]